MEPSDIQQLIAMLTPGQLQILLVVLGYVFGARAFYRGLIWLVQAYVQRTATKADDEALARVLAWTDPVVIWIDVLRRCSLGLTIGPFPSTQPIARSIAPQPMRPLSVPPPTGHTQPYGVDVIKPVVFVGEEGEDGKERDKP
jgi:hypothetical protein